jgi:hypothetical protein
VLHDHAEIALSPDIGDFSVATIQFRFVGGKVDVRPSSAILATL